MTAALDTPRREVHIDVVSEGARAVDLLSEAALLPKGRIKNAMAHGAVWVTRGAKTNRLRRATRALLPGDSLHLYYDEAVLSAEVPVPGLVADMTGYSVWDKPCQMYSQGSRWGDHCTVTRFAETHLEPQRNAFVVHRLDRAASGLVLVAHHKRIAAALSKLFRERRVDKRYRVHAQGVVGAVGETLVLDDPIDGKPAISRVTVRGYDAASSVSVLDVCTETGRKHQIRRHLCELGCPVVGDRLYGALNIAEDLRLRAYALGFHCPVSDHDVQFRVDPEGGRTDDP